MEVGRERERIIRNSWQDLFIFVSKLKIQMSGQHATGQHKISSYYIKITNAYDIVFNVMKRHNLTKQ